MHVVKCGAILSNNISDGTYNPKCLKEVIENGHVFKYPKSSKEANTFLGSRIFLLSMILINLMMDYDL